MKGKVEKVLRDVVLPMLSMHGGSVELVEVAADGVVKVRLSGACAGCPGARMTLAHVVESAIKDAIPEVTRVETVS
ncbi:MAG: NifU family protein [Candidatus Aureabacteria bacterium]|nr:NifU family protein [Candidatus Auribacterota bacterium]